MALSIKPWLAAYISDHDRQFGYNLSQECQQPRLCQIFHTFRTSQDPTAQVTATIADAAHTIQVSFDVAATNAYESHRPGESSESLTSALRSLVRLRSFRLRLEPPGRFSQSPRVELDVLDWTVLGGSRNDPVFYPDADCISTDKAVQAVIRKWWIGVSSSPVAALSPSVKTSPASSPVQQTLTPPVIMEATPITQDGRNVPVLRDLIQPYLDDPNKRVHNMFFDEPREQHQEDLDTINVFGIDVSESNQKGGAIASSSTHTQRQPAVSSRPRLPSSSPAPAVSSAARSAPSPVPPVAARNTNTSRQPGSAVPTKQPQPTRPPESDNGNGMAVRPVRARPQAKQSRKVNFTARQSSSPVPPTGDTDDSDLSDYERESRKKAKGRQSQDESQSQSQSQKQESQAKISTPMISESLSQSQSSPDYSLGRYAGTWPQRIPPRTQEAASSSAPQNPPSQAPGGGLVHNEEEEVESDLDTKPVLEQPPGRKRARPSREQSDTDSDEQGPSSPAPRNVRPKIETPKSRILPKIESPAPSSVRPKIESPAPRLSLPRDSQRAHTPKSSAERAESKRRVSARFGRDDRTPSPERAIETARMKRKASERADAAASASASASAAAPGSRHVQMAEWYQAERGQAFDAEQLVKPWLARQLLDQRGGY